MADNAPNAQGSGPALISTGHSLPGLPPRQTCWLEYQHPFYRANRDKWELALDHYTGDVLDSPKVDKYLVKRAVGESKEAYAERKALADYTNHFAEVVESLAGMVFAVEGDANRSFADENGLTALGDPDDPSTPIGKLWRAANREGDGYITVWKQLAILLSVVHFAWVFIDSLGPGRPIIRLLSPLSVPNWFEGPDGPELIIMEEFDGRQRLLDFPLPVLQYIHLTVKGWQRYKVDDGGNPQTVGEQGTWNYRDANGSPALPIFPVKLPMKRHVGYNLARKANIIFNKESERDHLLRVANFPRLVVPSTDEQFDNTMAKLAEGANAIQEQPDAGGTGQTRYIAPSTESAKLATEVVQQKVQDFHKTAHKQYDEGAGGARQKTATQVRQDVGSGTGAYLQLLKSGLDDAENNALWRLEQAVTDDPRKHHIAHVERTDDFMPDDPEQVLERSAAVVWGKDKSVPLGVTAATQIAKEIARHRGAEVDDAEVEAAVVVRSILDTMSEAATAGLTLPAIVRVEVLMKLLAANGLVDADQVCKDAEGNETKLLELVKQQALALMQAADDQKLRDGEVLYGNPGGGAGAAGAADAGGNGGDPSGGAGPQDAPPSKGNTNVGL